jgi:hypothetical protein
MHEVDQRFGIPPQLDGHRDRFLERVEELIRVPDLDFFVSAHPLLARQPLSLGPIEPHPIAAEPYLPHPVTRRGSHGGADVVRELGIDQRHGGGDAITPPDRPVTIPMNSMMPIVTSESDPISVFSRRTSTAGTR